MLFTNSTFLGIDPTAGKRPFSYAALDNELKLLALGQGNMDDVLAFAAGQKQAIAALCTPRQLNKGVMADPDVRKTLSPMPRPGRWGNFRMADYLLRQHNINVPQTPSNEDDCPNWMRVGFTLFRRMEQLGYCPFPSEGKSRQCMEVYPHACFTVLLGVIPFSKYTLEGRLQRQLTLSELGVDVLDPMRFFEEITRSRLLRGVLPFDCLHTTGELDALIAAYTAWLAINRSDQITLLGDPIEGQVVFPVTELRPWYSS